MRCSKARELYFGNYDGLIDEIQRMKLQAHLDRCPSCTAFVEEMDACLGMIKGLPEMAPSENFGWNLKRRILQEKSRLMRQAQGADIRDVRWGMKFISSAAAVIVVTLVGAWFMFGDQSTVPEYSNLADGPTNARHQHNVSSPLFDHEGLSVPGRPAGMRMISDVERGSGGGSGIVGPQAFEDAAESREDSLLRENEYLRLYIQRIHHENMILKQYLYRSRGRR